MLGVVYVRLIEVDIIGLQALQRVFHLAQDVGLRKPLLVGRELDADLGRQNYFLAIAAALEPVAEHGLRLAAFVARHPARVHVGGVDEIEPGADKLVQNGERSGLIRRPAKDISAQANGRDFEARPSQLTGLHLY